MNRDHEQGGGADRGELRPLPTLDAQAAAASRKAAWFWGALVVGLLGTQVLVGVGSVMIAIADPSASVVPDYYQKALAWDDEMARRAASEALGWEAEIDVSEGADLLGQRTLVLTLTDRDGRPLDGADVELRLFHHARASDPQRVELRGHGSGRYSGTAVMRRAGLWQVDLAATRGLETGPEGETAEPTESFVLSQTMEVGRAKPVAGGASR